MKKIIYFHGFASGPNSIKEKEIAKEFEVYSPNVPYSFQNVSYLINQVGKWLTDNVQVGDEVLFVGTSLGGYFATYLAFIFDAKALVFNPVVDPFEDLKVFVGLNTNFSDNSEFFFSYNCLKSFEDKSLFNLIPDHDVNVRAVVCTEDYIIPSWKALSYFKNVVKIENSDHRFIDLDSFMQYVKES